MNKTQHIVRIKIHRSSLDVYYGDKNVKLGLEEFVNINLAEILEKKNIDL